MRDDAPTPAEYLEIEVAGKFCPACGGTGTPQTRPDSFGNWDPCDPCEGTGLVDFERDRPWAA